MELIVSVDKLTKHYKNDKGIFDVTFNIKKGEVFGFLGPNGAGKTTTIRHILGFQKQDGGKCTIKGLDSWKDSVKINAKLGYVAGEIVFPNSGTGWKFIQQMAQYKSMPNLDYAKELVNRFQFNPNVRLKAMSKGMKQKVAIVVAFMNKPDMLVLDEPTSGLDPLMQLEFDKLLLEFKKAGTTILMSSHIFSEIEKVCDRVAIIKEGKIITDVQLSDIRHAIEKTYKIEFLDSTDFKNAKSNFTKKKFYNIKANDKKNQMYIVFDDKYTNEFINELSNYKIKFINQIQESLEEYFMQYYNNGEKFSFKDIKKSILNEKKGEKE